MSLGSLLGVFALIFVLELPDKTMIATIVMSSRARPLAVALGASAGFVVQMGIAVGAGGLLTLLPAHLKDAIVGLLFLGGAAYLLLVKEKTEEEEGERAGETEKSASWGREAFTAFSVIFIGEFGDLTQIQAANFAAKFHQPLEVFAACSAALVGVAFLGAFAGQALQRVVPLSKIRFGGGLIFLGLGVYTFVRLATS
ncbi:MAG: TMEM165/GDT1 family protein [Actinomycetota bacterium]|nr:TMEM165/GDT1 family protein [Actinomycetota bacterium]